MAGKLCLPSNSAPILPATLFAPSTASSRSHNKRRIIACVSCHKQKKKCDNGSPCTRCAATGRQCTYPIKPPDRRYNSKKWKLPTPAASPSPFPSSPIHNHPLPFPAALWNCHDQNISLRQHQQQSPGLPSPSPSSSTVGTPQPSYAASSYGDSTPATPVTGNSGGREGSADSGCSRIYPAVKDLVNPRGVIGVVSLPTPSPVLAPQPTTAEAPPRFGMPDLIDELLRGVPYKSHYANAPVFGLEEPEPIDISSIDFSIFGDTNIGDALKAAEAYQDINTASSSRRRTLSEPSEVGKAKRAKGMESGPGSEQQKGLETPDSVHEADRSGSLRGSAGTDTAGQNPEWSRTTGEMDGDMDLSWLDPEGGMPEHLDLAELDFYNVDIGNLPDECMGDLRLLLLTPPGSSSPEDNPFSPPKNNGD
ncbi:hypothetical protein RUND412_010850 [Rhizina undulata]